MMRALKILFLGLFILALLNSPSTASTFSEADGWYKWSVDSPVNVGSSCCGGTSGALAIYVRSRDGGPVRIRAYNVNCDKGPEEDVTDLGALSLAQSDALLLEIVQATNVDMDVREDALLWLVLTGSDETFEYVDRLLSSR